jgi:U4/U6.U5 tri-snRNP-associated protein 1
MTDKKEIFRYISHKFHGKTSGKGKTEKRMQKLQETELSRKMESGDTPLGLTETMRRKMADSGSAHIVMAGGQEALKKRKKKKPTK